MILVADDPAVDLLDALAAAGAFPIVETKWADAPAAFSSVKPGAVVIAELGAPPNEAAARKLSERIAAANEPIVPVVARVSADRDAALPEALAADAALPVERLMARLQSAMRVRALHATVLRRIEALATHDTRRLSLPASDALDDATVLIAGRGPLYPKLSVAMGDGFSPRIVEAFLTVIAQETRFRDIPIAVIGEAAPELIEALPTIDHVDGDPGRLVARMVPLLRMHAFEGRLKRMLKSLDADGMFDPATGLHSRDMFWHELGKAAAEAGERSMALSLARLSFDGLLDPRTSVDGARLLTRLIRNIDFACRDEDGSLLIAFPQTDLRSAHVIARRIAGALKNTLLAPNSGQAQIAANLTLATLKAGDTLDSLLLRVSGVRVVAAE